MDGFLLTEKGKVFEGKLLGSFSPSMGELVFTTSMQGYTESITDPSYYGQILIFTFPLIGNYGILESHKESENVWVNGIIASDIYDKSNFINFIESRNVPALIGIDTRMLVREIAHTGSIRGIIYPGKPDKELKNALDILERSKNPYELPLFRETASKKRIIFNSDKEINIALIDFGVKKGIIENLLRIGNITLIPYFEEFSKNDFDAIVLSNGPGDPKHPELNDVVHSIRNFKKPMLGICLGHQLIARSFGLETYKMKFGHRGVNHPVIHNGRVYITTHNHGFAVEDNWNEDIIVTYRDLNDNTVEGIKHVELPIMGVQFHPESRPGTSDMVFIFNDFKKMVIEYAKG